MENEIPNWAISGRCFFLGTLPYMLRVTSGLFAYLNITTEHHFTSIYSPILIELLLLCVLKMSIVPKKFEVAWRAFLLGAVLNLGLALNTYSSSFETLGIYFIFLSIFHWSEYMTQAIFNPETTDVDNFMLYHSDAYVIAFFAALVEFAAEYYYWPSLKEPGIMTKLGISFIVFGECLRKSSMWTAKSNFNHYVQFSRHEDHELVTHGVYSLFRHPSYVGWFWWSVGTQCILLNPFCIVAYAAASWKFFSERIYTEEMTLIKFFGTQYIEYQQKVGTGFPFIYGYTIDVTSQGNNGEEEVQPEHEKDE